MKKIAFLMLIGGLFCGANVAFSATYDCEYQKIYDQYANHNLFVGNIFADGSGYGFACGHEGTKGCPQDEQILVSGSHWFDNFLRDGIKGYSCNRKGWDNKWVDLNVYKIQGCRDITGWSELGVLDGVHIFCKNPVSETHRDGRSVTYCARNNNICRMTSENILKKKTKYTGIVKDKNNDKSLSGAKVVAVVSNDDDDTCFSDAKGRFECGFYSNILDVSLDGYETKRVTYLTTNAQMIVLDKKQNDKPKTDDGNSQQVESETTVTADVAKKWKDAYICGEGECGYYGETKDIFGGCTATNKDCTGKPDNSKTSECKYVAKTNDENAEKFYTCHATSCNDGYWEWFVKKDSQYVGKGICHSKTVVERCMNECNNCPDGQTCKPVYVKDEKQRENRGYAGCSCQPIDSAENNQEKPKEEIKEKTGIKSLEKEEIKRGPDNVCYFIYKFEIDCNEEVIPGEDKIDITALVSDENCSVDGDKLEKVYNDKKDEIIANIKNIIKENCPTAAADTGAEKPELDPNTKAAIAKLDALFGGKRTVWRTEEGKFNTARLASDATAGVVLGTVGGIVSGKVIKKKQLEKGFDALQCTVGGQKMADYGDTFQVTFRR